MAAPTRLRVPARIDFAGGWTDVADYSAKEGGLVLHAAIWPGVEAEASWGESGLSIAMTLDAPPDSHLGTSSSVNVAWVRLTHSFTGMDCSAAEIAETAWKLETLLGNKGGKQDQYAAALGGFNLLRFGAEDEPAVFERLALGEDRVAALRARLILCHARKSTDSGANHRRVWERFGDGDAAVLAGLRRIRASVEPARDALVTGDWAAFGGLLTENREAARSLGGGSITEGMDRLFAAAEEAGALGGKGCGAGPGGMIIVLAEPERREAVERALVEAGGAVRDYAFAPVTD